MHRQFLNRRGATFKSYALVFAVFSTVASIGVYVLSSTFASLDRLATAFPSSGQPPIQSQETAETPFSISEQLTLSQDYLYVSEFAYVIVSLLSIVLLSFLYLRKLKQKLAIENNQVCRLDVSRPDNAALESVHSKQDRLERYFRNHHLEPGSGFVGDIMSTSLETIEATKTIEEANKKIANKGYRRLIVVDNENNLVGVISKKDIKSKEGVFVKDVMTDSPKTADRLMSIGTALAILLRNRISCLPVIENRKFVGLLSTSDLLIYLQCVVHSAAVNKSGSLK